MDSALTCKGLLLSHKLQTVQQTGNPRNTQLTPRQFKFCEASSIYVIGETDVFNLEFNEAMRHYKADYYYANLPRPYTDLQAVFLPRQVERSAKVADILREKGFFDLGQYLQDLSFKGASARFIQ